MNQKDIEIIATVMREQHGVNAAKFVRQQMHYHGDKAKVSETWKAVLDELLRKVASPDEARNG